MKKPTLTEIKNKAKNHVPEIIAAASVVTTIATIVYYRLQWPNDKVYIKWPEEVAEGLRNGRTLLVTDPKVGQFIVQQYHPKN